MYNITKPTTSVKGNELGIFEDLGDHFSIVDLHEFFLTLAPQIPQSVLPEYRLIDGAYGNSKSPATAGPESDLDFQISYPIIYPQNSVLFQTDDTPTETNYTYEGFLNNFLDAIDGSYCSYSAFGETGNSPLDPPYPDPKAGGYKGKLQCGKYKPTNVITISYGGQEYGFSMAYQRRQCNEFMKLGMQGISVFVASGDSGVGGQASGNDNGCINQTIFQPDFPSTCPYITTVGATTLPAGGDVNKDQETATTRFGSGGGFSNSKPLSSSCRHRNQANISLVYPIPAYQSAAVNTYLTQHTPPYKAYKTTYEKSIGANGGVYNAAGRGYPDISAVGDNIVIFNMGAPTLIGGTSAASPLFAAVLTRINEERLKAGKSTVGFINPTLYKNPSALHDITMGTNPGCGTNGFSAAKGWDPLTGLGTPNYPALLKVFMALA